MSSKALYFATVLLFSSFILFPTLGLSKVFLVSEGREGVVVGEVLRTDNYVLPMRHGQIVPSKPVLVHDIGALVYKAVNGSTYDEFYLRFPSALAAIACVVIVFSYIYSWCGPRPALLAAGILLSSNGFLALSRDGRVDMWQGFFVSWAILLWMGRALNAWKCGEKLRQIPGSTYWLVGVLCGLGALAKGPTGLILPALVIVCTAFSLEGIRGILSLTRLGWISALIVSLPWYLAAYFQAGESFLQRQIFFENLQRFFGAEGIPRKPIYFYVMEFWNHAAPWSFLFGLFMFFIVVGSRTSTDTTSGSDKTVKNFSLIWFWSLFVFFSLSVGKRSSYLLTSLPAMSIYLGITLDSLSRNERHSPIFRRIACLSVIVLVIMLGLGALLITLVQDSYLQNLYPNLRMIGDLSAVLSQHGLKVIFMTAVLLSISLACWRKFLRTGDGFFSVLTLIVAVFGCFGVGLGIGQAVKAASRNYQQVATEIKALMPSEQSLTFLKDRRDELFDGLFFYYPDRVAIANKTAEISEHKYYAARVHYLRDIKGLSEYQFNVLAILGRDGDLVDEQVVIFRTGQTLQNDSQAF